MKLVIRTVVFHFLCIFIFAILYFIYKTHFNHQTKKELEFLDYLLLSTTIQAGVGISDVFPTNNLAKFMMISQQFILIMTHVITLYIFS